MINTQITENNENRKLQQLARMADCRKRVSAPDVDAEWEAFCAKHIDGVDSELTYESSKAVVERREAKAESREKRVVIWKMVGSALAGAAAMFVGAVIFFNIYGTKENLIALQYDDTPQQITLSAEGSMEDLSNLDSISFVESVKSVGISVDEAANEVQESKMQCLSTPRGMDFKIVLQDGTEVWLNAESSIEFPSAFTGDDRKVNLRGEAYFKVAHNAEKPFKVNLGDKTVYVLGTEFDVRNYASEHSSVVLVNGSVQLFDNEGKQEVTLVPGQGATWTENGNVNVHDVDTYGTTQWIDGLFYFEEHSLGEVLREVGRWYNYGVVFKNNEHISYKVHFSASRNDDIQSVLDDLNTLCRFKLTIENKNIVVY